MNPWLIPSPLAEMLSHRVVIGDFKIEPKQLAEPEVVAQLPLKIRREVARVALERILKSGKHRATLRKRMVTSDIKVPADFKAAVC